MPQLTILSFKGRAQVSLRITLQLSKSVIAIAARKLEASANAPGHLNRKGSLYPYDPGEIFSYHSCLRKIAAHLNGIDVFHCLSVNSGSGMPRSHGEK